MNRIIRKKGGNTFNITGSLVRNTITVGRLGSGADFECDGVADDVEISQAIAQASTVNKPINVEVIGYGYDYTYSIANTIEIPVKVGTDGVYPVVPTHKGAVFKVASNKLTPGSLGLDSVYRSKNFYSEINTNYNSYSTIGNFDFGDLTIMGNATNQARKTATYATFANFPTSGQVVGRIYVARDTDTGYNWSGTAYTTGAVGAFPAIANGGKHWRAYTNHLIKLYGYNYRTRGIYLQDASEFAYYSEQTNTDTNVFNDYATMEASLNQVRIVGYGLGGINWYGPHDSRWADVKIHTNQYSSEALYNAFITQTPNANGGGLVLDDVHPWGPTASYGSNLVIKDTSVYGNAYVEGSSNTALTATNSTIQLDLKVTNAGANQIKLKDCYNTVLNIDNVYQFAPIGTIVKLEGSFKNSQVDVRTIDTNNVGISSKVFDITALTSDENISLRARIPFNPGISPNNKQISAGVVATDLSASSEINIIKMTSATAFTTIKKSPFPTGGGPATSDDLVEGVTNLYYTPKKQAELNSKYKTDNVIVGAHFPGYTGSGNTTPTLLSTLETDTGANNLGALLFKGLSSGGTYTSTDFQPVADILNTGRICVYNLEPNGILSSINAGNFDAQFTQFKTLVDAYALANPNFYPGQLLVKFMHEGNLSVGAYDWVIFDSRNLGETFNKFTTTKAVIDTAIGNFKTAYQRLANLLVSPNILRVFELGQDNFAGGMTQLDDFFPTPSYYEVVSANSYNRYGISSGYAYSSPLGDNLTAWLTATDRKAPQKPKMIGETSSTALSIVNPFGTSQVTITSGGAGFPASQVNQPVPASAIINNGATSPQFNYSSNASGVITSFSLVNKGRDVTSCTINSSFLGGTGLTTTVNLRQTGINKANWIRDAFDYVKNNTDIRYMFWFLEEKPVSVTDNRDWSLSIPADKTAFGLGVQSINDRESSPLIGGKGSPNLCIDPYTKTVTSWNGAGGNVGTVSLTTNSTNLPPYDRQITSAIRITHSATAGTFDSKPFSNRLGFIIPYWNGGGTWNNGYQPNEPLTIEFDALYKPYGNPASYSAPLLVAIEDLTGGNYERSVPPQFELQKQYKRYRVVTSNGQVSATGYNVFFGIGSATTSGELIITNASMRIGSNLQPLNFESSAGSVTQADLTSIFNQSKRYALIH
jgi:hypothetical protein